MWKGGNTTHPSLKVLPDPEQYQGPCFYRCLKEKEQGKHTFNTYSLIKMLNEDPCQISLYKISQNRAPTEKVIMQYIKANCECAAQVWFRHLSDVCVMWLGLEFSKQPSTSTVLLKMGSWSTSSWPSKAVRTSSRCGSEKGRGQDEVEGGRTACDRPMWWLEEYIKDISNWNHDHSWWRSKSISQLIVQFGSLTFL